MKKILVTGACGYLGARLSKYLAEKGYSVTAFDSYDPSTHNEWKSLMDEVIIEDIRDETVISNLADKNFDVAIQLISLDHYKSENNLFRTAVYPTAKVWHWGIILAMILLESVMNGFMLGQGAERGLVGGVVIAVGIAFLNVLLY